VYRGFYPHFLKSLKITREYIYDVDILKLLPPLVTKLQFKNTIFESQQPIVNQLSAISSVSYLSNDWYPHNQSYIYFKLLNNEIITLDIVNPNILRKNLKVKKLILRKFNNFIPNCLPDNTQELILCDIYDKPLSKYSLPPNLKILRIGKHFNHIN
jgi:hypothetical protein